MCVYGHVYPYSVFAECYRVVQGRKWATFGVSWLFPSRQMNIVRSGWAGGKDAIGWICLWLEKVEKEGEEGRIFLYFDTIITPKIPNLFILTKL